MFRPEALLLPLLTPKSFYLPRNEDGNGICSSFQDWEGFFRCKINKNAIYHLMNDDPGKRRKVYMEFILSSDSQDSQSILEELKEAGFDMSTLKRPTGNNLSSSHTSEYGFSCLITGSSQTILNFLQDNQKVLLASIDLPEYSWLSASSQAG